MSATRLLVLGVVRMYGSAHGYQVRRELLTWSADKWANVAPGSIYHALKKMAAEKLLEEVSTEEEAQGPDRTAYRLTPDGETEFGLLLSRYLAESDDSAQGSHRLAAAVTFLPALPRATVLSLLRHRLTQVAGQRATAQDMLDHGTEWGQPEHVEELYGLWVASVGAQEVWLRGLVERLEAGRYVMADDEGAAFGSPSNQI
ncbi:PadR family transcriptional regulator [Actinophytocola oryzae]|uniref:PadR family transcriptional regulator n=1 Tax=Actinophytocola oryzae TaxID=502181 RepID=A0A4R7V926_9PSEU|nr:PadR family transcriptional regulator [Actinophytocola oryzae]TDV45423.1 PadR family transcriptional regulator [Actinophytocola oryzae]